MGPGVEGGGTVEVGAEEVPTAGVAPEDDFRGAEPLLRARARRQLGAQRRPELVRVEVEDGEVAQVPRGQHAPVRAAAGDGQLPELAEAIRLRRNVAETVGDARRVVLARVVPEAGLSEHVVRPRGTAVDRERGRPVGERLLPGGSRDRLDRAVEVGAKGFGLLVVDTRVCVAVRGGLVAAADDLGDQVAMPLDRRPEQEERRPRVELVEQVE